MLKRLDNVGIAVRDAARTISFYTDVLGFQGQLQGTEGSVSLGDVSFYIFQSTAAPGAGPGRSTDYYANPVGLDHLAFEVDDIEAAGKALEAKGVVFDQAVVGEPGQFRYRGFKDPDGNMLYIIQKGA